MNDFARWIDAYWPLVNTAILLLMGGWLLAASRGWSGVGQDARLRALENFRDNVNRRLGNIEIWNHDQMAAEEKTNKMIFDEIRKVALSMADISLRLGDVSKLEMAQADLEQEVQFLKDLGCGFPGCPRSKAVQGEKE